MKTHAFKKAISVVCVLAMLMSLCVVSFVGTANAAETYTLYENGVERTVQLNSGDALPSSADLSDGIKFVGWYNDDYSQSYTTAGAEKTLYAKYTSTFLDFENGKQYFHPHEGEAGYHNFGAAGLYGFTITEDPTNSSNKVLKRIYTGGTTFAIPITPSSNNGYTLTKGTKYEVNFDYYFTDCESATAGKDNGIIIEPYYASDLGVGHSGNKSGTGASKSFKSVSSYGWQNYSIIFTAGAKADTESYLMLYIASIDGNITNSVICLDNISVTVVEDRTITFNNKGTITSGQYKIGSALPDIQGASFLGWYDKTLTTKYNSVSGACTSYYAKYTGVSLDFEDGGYYDPSNNLGSTTSANAGTEPNSSNKVMIFNHTGSSETKSFAPVGANGASSGLKLGVGNTYDISFKYFITGASASGVYLGVGLANDAGIGGAASNQATTALAAGTGFTNTNGQWCENTFRVTITDDAATYPNLIVVSKDNSGASATSIVYIDQFVVKQYVPEVDVNDYVMDFEKNPWWSVAGANNFTVSSGNGYVSRGEIVADGASNHVFELKNFDAKGKYIFFTINDSVSQFEMVNGGLYTISFDYKITHSETEVDLGLAYIKPTTSATGAEISPFKVIEEITYRDDLEPRDNIEWQHVEYAFCANSDANSKSSLGIYLYNETQPPLQYATTVQFDNVVVKTHSTSGDKSLVTFDTLGGNTVPSKRVETGKTLQSLPVPEKYGYDFIGWKYDVVTGSGVNTYDLTTSTVINDLVLNAYAEYKISDGVIALNFETNVPDYDAEVGTVIAFPGKPINNLPKNPTRAGQKFIGWFTDRQLTKPLDLNVAPATSCTLYAKWESTGTVVDFERYPQSILNDGNVVATRFDVIKTDDGNHVMHYDMTSGVNSDLYTHARFILYDNVDKLRAYESNTYKITFKYQILSADKGGRMCIYLANKNDTWKNNTLQEVTLFDYKYATDGWVNGEFTFDAIMGEGFTADDNYLYFGISGDGIINLDDIVITGTENSMNIYGSVLRFHTMGGRKIDALTGEAGDPIKMPTPYRAGYKFLGWTADRAGTTPFTATKLGDDAMVAFAQWQLGKLGEGFEDYPMYINAIGISSAYSLYNNKTPGFDAANVRTGETSIFRNGTTAGTRAFTLMRDSKFILNIGDTYTISLYVKPTSVTENLGTIELHQTAKFADIAKAKYAETLAVVGGLKENEWNLVTYTFTAKTRYYALATSVGNDMYIDDIAITLQGYTGPEAGYDDGSDLGAATGDSSVSPYIVLAMIILSAGAMIIAGKKVFAR